MKHKFLSLLVAIAASVGMMNAEVINGTCGTNLTWSLNTEDSTLTISGTGAMSNYNISNNPVPWKQDTALIKYLILEDGITYIGTYAFYNCINLVSVTFPNSVESMGNYVFQFCSSLTSVTIPQNVTSIGKQSFRGCSGLKWFACKAVTPPTLGSDVFYSVHRKTPMFVPAESNDAYKNAAWWSEFVNYPIIHGNCGDNLMWYLSSDTTTLNIVGTGAMGDYAPDMPTLNTPWVSYCNQITSVSLPEGLTYIGGGALSKTKITNVVIPGTVTKIGYRAFEGCSNLSSVTIPDNSVTQIDAYAFQGSKITSIVIPSTVNRIGFGAFDGCSNLSSVTIPDNSVTQIDPDAFKGSKITSIVIPNSVTYIGEGALWCSLLDTIYCNAVNPPTIDKWVFGRNPTKTPIILLPCSANLSAYQQDAQWSQYNVSYQSSYTYTVEVSENVEIRQQPTECNGNTAILYAKDSIQLGADIGAGSYWVYGYQYFQSWDNGSTDKLRTAVITKDTSFAANYKTYSHLYFNVEGEGVIQIADTNAKSGWFDASSLTLTAVPNEGYKFEEWVIREQSGHMTEDRGRTSDNPLTINHEYGEYYYTARFSGGSSSGQCGENLTWTLDENGLLTISGIGTMWDFESGDDGAQVPWDASKITSVVIEEGVTTIGDNAFNMTTGWNANEQVYSHYDGPQTVNLPNSLTSIGKSAFMNCTNVEYLFIPANVVDIYNQAFYGCSSLKVIKVESPIPARLLDKYDDEILELWDVVPWEYIFPSYDNLIFYVPCGSRDAYVQAWGMDYHHYYYGTYSSDQTQVREHFLYPPLKYTIECTANDSNLGETTFPLTSCDEMILTATPKSGCHFVKWSDGVEDNPRSIELTQDTAFKGIFARNPVITFKCNDEQGYIEGETSTPTGMASGNISIAAYPFRGYHFITWADGNIDNPRTIMLTQDTIMEAIFDYTLNGKCGKNEALTWTLDTTNMALAISGSGELTENYSYVRKIESVTIGNEITSIGEYAFESFNHLNNIILGANVKVIEQYAFAYTYSVSSEDGYTQLRTYPTITCYSQRPPTVREYAFDYDMPYSTIVYVPADYVSTYKAHEFWGLYDVRPLSAQQVETEGITVTPASTSVQIVWPSVNGAATYELVIKDKSGNVICTLTFNANGQLIQLAFNAPARDKAVNHTGFLFTVTGLEEGTTYDYTIVSKDSNGNVLDTQSGSFTTTGEQGIENVDALSKSIKVIRNGQLLIEKNGKTYNVVGAEVK